MPVLQLFGRKWAFASDDLPVLALFGALFHGAWLLLIISFAIYAYSVDTPEKCEGRVELAAFMACLLLSLLVSTICDVLIVWHGCKGAIFQSSYRKHVYIVMYWLTINLVVKICIAAYGTYLVFIQKPTCLRETHELNEVMRAVIISTWVIIFLYVLLSIISYQAFPKNSVLQWKRRIRFVNWCCCGTFHHMESEPLARMALVFEKFFKPLDFSVTDTLVAMILAAKHQTFSRYRSHDPSSSSTSTNQGSLMEPAVTMKITEKSTNAIFSDSLSSIEYFERQSTKLPPVMEDDELNVMEEGRTFYQEREDQLEIKETINHPLENDLVTSRSTQTTPGHRRTNAFDFRQVEFQHPFSPTMHRDRTTSDQSSSDLIPPQLESSIRGDHHHYHEPQQSINWSFADDTYPHSSLLDDTVSEREPSDLRQPNQESSTNEDRAKCSSNDTDVDDDDDDAASVETTLVWADDFTGPYLIPTDNGFSHCLATSSPSVDYDTLERMELYHRYALASYGAVLYLASGKKCSEQCGRCFNLFIKAGAPNLTFSWSKSREQTDPHYDSQSHHHLHGSQITHRNQQYPQRSGCLIERLNEAAVSKYGFKEENILYRSHEDVLAGHLPYFVALDNKEKAIVVAVRGTWSWPDIVTDFLIQPETLNKDESAQVLALLEELYGPNQQKVENKTNHLSVHSGMLRSARGLIISLEKNGILDFLERRNLHELPLFAKHAYLIDQHKDGDDQDDNYSSGSELWKFVMTGHSLGAGVVALATLLLKSRYRHYRKIECYAISPPACVMSAELASAISPFCVSLVHGKDIVPRISIKTAERLRDQMVRAATLCKKSKMEILLSSFRKIHWLEDELFFQPEELDQEPLTAMKQYRGAVKRTEEKDGLHLARRFITPGRIVFLRPKKIIEKATTSVASRTETTTRKGKNKTNRTFEAVWISGKDLTDEGILLSLFMIKDHFPFFSIESLSEVLKQRQSY